MTLRFPSLKTLTFSFLLPLLFGLLTVFAQPPFDSSLSLFTSFFPLFSFVVCIPFLLYALGRERPKALFKAYLFGIGANISQFAWLSLVSVDGLWPLIMLGLLLLTSFLGLQWLLLAAIFRWLYRRIGIWIALVFPACWVVVDWLRTLGDMSFPWGFAGYSLTGLPWLAQGAALGGVWLLTFVVVAANVSLCMVITSVNKRIQNYLCTASNVVSVHHRVPAFLVLFLCVAISVYGMIQMRSSDSLKKCRVALVQNNMDQANWDPRRSLDSALAITEQMIATVDSLHPDLIVLPESGIYCYYVSTSEARAALWRWVRTSKATVIFGSLHYERCVDNPLYRYRAYNSVFVEALHATRLRYDKIRLVPFSEALPFEGAFPIISRINLGESDFARGTEETIFDISTVSIHAAPFLCYEIIYPDFVRRRAAHGASLLVNLTNDGWFGRSNAPWQHAAMARMRAIENGVPLIRCANSGVSLVADPQGRVAAHTGLYERKVLVADVPLVNSPTIYRRFGDWFVALSAAIVAGALLLFFAYSIRRKNNPVR